MWQTFHRFARELILESSTNLIPSWIKASMVPECVQNRLRQTFGPFLGPYPFGILTCVCCNLRMFWTQKLCEIHPTLSCSWCPIPGLERHPWVPAASETRAWVFALVWLLYKPPRNLKSLSNWAANRQTWLGFIGIMTRYNWYITCIRLR